MYEWCVGAKTKHIIKFPPGTEYITKYAVFFDLFFDWEKCRIFYDE